MVEQEMHGGMNSRAGAGYTCSRYGTGIIRMCVCVCVCVCVCGLLYR